MRFVETALAGVFVVEVEPFTDDRGTFGRAWCADEFRAHGLEPVVAQTNYSTNRLAGTVRGLHFQTSPPEAKFLRCVAGSVYDVVVDLRPESATYRQHVGTELRAGDGRAVYCPPQFGHGYQALEDGAAVLYNVSSAYSPGAEQGIRPDDPELAIQWPLPIGPISAKDAGWPLLTPVPAPATASS